MLLLHGSFRQTLNRPTENRFVLIFRPLTTALQKSEILKQVRDDSKWLFLKARFRHSDKAPGRNLDAIASLL
jgi:hypothetical protein